MILRIFLDQLKEKKLIKDEILGHVRAVFDSSKDYFELIKSGVSPNDTFKEHKGNNEKYENFSLANCLDEIFPYLKDLINGLKDLIICEKLHYLPRSC